MLQCSRDTQENIKLVLFGGIFIVKNSRWINLKNSSKSKLSQAIPKIHMHHTLLKPNYQKYPK
jgi:hypothetical protein